jgi:aminoglycoside phosphotransferase (APT) family kinase protein
MLLDAMRDDLGPRLLEYLRATPQCPQVDFAEELVPISGGFDTEIFAFRLSGAAPALSGPLVLRVLAPHHDPLRALRERAIQNAVADMGFPAPRVPLASADPEILGGAFLVMERRPGRPLLAARRLGIAALLVETHLRLHALHSSPLLGALERAVPGSSALVSLDGHLGQLESRIGRNLHGLAPAMRWLLGHRPDPEGPRAICHGDFHPQNLLFDGREITAVLDWPNVLVADPAYDVAATRVILEQVPLEILSVSGPARWAVAAARRLLVALYLRGYRRRRPLAASALGYYEALACMRGLVRTAEHRIGARQANNPLDTSSFGDRLAARFAKLTGIRPKLGPTLK